MASAPKTVVFGGSGFLGSHVADVLADNGHKVTIFDKNASPYLRPDQTMRIGDILSMEQVVAACEGAEYIYNFAGLADINEAKSRPVETAHLNIVGHVNILEGALKAKAKRFVFASSVYVYSESGAFYGASKQAAERFTELYFSRFGLPYTILRYGSLYGRRADHRNTIFKFIKNALEKKEIVYHGTGDELREYINVVDASTASHQILAPEYENQHVVLTGVQTMRVRDVMKMIAEILGGDVKLKCANEGYEEHYTITPYAYKPRLGKKLTTNPFVDMGQGILDCVHELDGIPK